MTNPNLLSIIDAFSTLNVLVIGEAMLDSYLMGASERLCREAPVPVVSVSERLNVPGGAANTAVNVRSLGANVTFLSMRGDDAYGDSICQALEAYGVPAENVLICPHRDTLAKHRIVSSGQMLLRFDVGSTGALDAEMEQVLIDRLEKLFPWHDVIIVSDYNYGILTPHVIQALAKLQAQEPRMIVVDSKRLPIYRNVHITAVKPNYDEALELLGLPKRSADNSTGDRVTQIAAHGAKILEYTGAQIAAITLDQEGALIFEKDRPPYRTYAKPAPHSRAPGAGDTFISAFSLALAAGGITENAVELASAAASIVVNKDGTAVCDANELRSFFSVNEKFVTDAFGFAARLASYRREGKKIVFTNGCFDILHRGHITYLNRAKALGDILIVGLNSDASVRRLKGPTRPINPLEDRAQILAALSCVDHIVPFDGDTPHEPIRLIQPNVFVKGGDYTLDRLPEASLVEELGGEVMILPFLEDHSTSGIIERIRQLYAGPAGWPQSKLANVNGDKKAVESAE